MIGSRAMAHAETNMTWVDSHTEAQWLEQPLSDSDKRVLALELGSERKQRLYGVAMCRMIWDYVALPACRRAVEVAEQLADGLASEHERRVAASLVNRAMHPSHTELQLSEVEYFACSAAQVCGYESSTSALFCRDFGHVAFCAQFGFDWRFPPWNLQVWTENLQTIHHRIDLGLDPIYRDIFRNPYRPVIFDPMWRTSRVIKLARGMYEDREFDRMPILADALMDAGCADEQILGHCRGKGPHVRGCWVVDLVLGKE